MHPSRRAPLLSRTALRLALTVEMHLLLGPASILVLIVAMPAFLLGFPHGIAFAAAPVARHDAAVLSLMAALPPAAFALWTFWVLGMRTTARRYFAFGLRFWLALAAGLGAAGLIADVLGPRTWLALAPVGLFLLHMVVLQGDLRPRA
jgi:hypothetical protein